MSAVQENRKQPFDKLWRDFKRKTAKSGVMSEIKKREHYNKPSVAKKLKQAAAQKRRQKKNNYRRNRDDD
jgi:small subunit ribosomal protein S21